MGRKLTIGALAERTGVPVRTLRFYSDEGLLPPLLRSHSGYRMYGEEHAVRVDLIRTLRDAGVGLEEIAKVLKRELALEEVLALRLRAVESQIGGLRRVASALRLALELGPTEQRLRRITMATRASNEDRKSIVKAFYEKVVEGLPVERAWVDGMVEASSPAMPESPSAEQLAAWMELEGLLGQSSFLECKRVIAADMWAPTLDRDALFDAQIAALGAVREARDRGVSPSSDEAGAIARAVIDALAAASGQDPAHVHAHMRTKFDPTGARHWELVAVMRGEASGETKLDDWRWFGEALAHHADEART